MQGAGAGTGFSALLRGASLADLVQMECLGRLRSTVRVVSGERRGTLYFERGKIVHAETGRAQGEDAALEILSWDAGTLETVVASREGAAAPASTIACAPEVLLLRAAQARDEKSRPNLVALPGRDGGETQGRDRHTTMGFDATRDERSTQEREATQDGRDLPIAVRLGAGGEVIEAVNDELADAVAYAARLGGLIGELLGLDALQAMEFASKKERLLAFVEGETEMAAVRVPVSLNVSGLRQRVGL